MTQSAYRVDWITDNLAVGQAPMSYDALDAIRSLGINAVLNLCAEFCDLHGIQAKAGFEVYYLPIVDEEAPDLSELEKALDWLDECLYLGKKVLVHCRFGIGRTGTVVNAYLLRKGLGHRLAGKTLKGLRSQPANFNQWWFIRKYGKKEKPLTIREPSLESRHLVDLFPFFANYEQVLARIDEALLAESSPPSCGRDHDACCRTPLTLSFIETVYLSHLVNATLERQARLDLITRATEKKGTVPFFDQQKKGQSLFFPSAPAVRPRLPLPPQPGRDLSRLRRPAGRLPAFGPRARPAPGHRNLCQRPAGAALRRRLFRVHLPLPHRSAAVFRPDRRGVRPLCPELVPPLVAPGHRGTDG